MKFIYFLFLTFTVYFCGLSLLGYQNLNYILFEDVQQNTLGVYFKNMVTLSEVDLIKNNFQSEFKKSEIKVWTPEEQYQDFVKTNLTSLEKSFNPEDIISTLPLYLEIKFENARDFAKALQSPLFKSDFIDTLSTNNTWTNRFASIVVFFNSGGKLLFLFVFFATAFIVVSAVRVLSQERIKEYYVRFFLGQSYFQIFKPTATTILVLSLSSYMVGLFFVYATYFILKSKAAAQSDLFFIYKKVSFLNFDYILILTASLLLVVSLALFFSFKKVSLLLDEK